MSESSVFFHSPLIEERVEQSEEEQRKLGEQRHPAVIVVVFLHIVSRAVGNVEALIKVLKEKNYLHFKCFMCIFP